MLHRRPQLSLVRVRKQKTKTKSAKNSQPRKLSGQNVTPHAVERMRKLCRQDFLRSDKNEADLGACLGAVTDLTNSISTGLTRRNLSSATIARHVLDMLEDNADDLPQPALKGATGISIPIFSLFSLK